MKSLLQLREFISHWRRPAIPLMVVVVAMAGCLYWYRVDIGHWLSGRTVGEHPLRLAVQPVYRIRKKGEWMGMRITQIVSRRQPVEFLVVENAPRQLVDRAYGVEPNPAWAGLMANQLLRLRQGDPDRNGAPVSLEVQRVHTLRRGSMVSGRKTFPYWQVEVQFRLNQEPESRFYDAGIVRMLPTPRPAQQESLVIGYARREAFQKELLTELLSYLSF